MTARNARRIGRKEAARTFRKDWRLWPEAGDLFDHIAEVARLAEADAEARPETADAWLAMLTAYVDEIKSLWSGKTGRPVPPVGPVQT